MTDRYAETDTWPNPPASQQPARPATLAASEPPRVAGEGSDAQETREASYAEALMRLPWHRVTAGGRVRGVRLRGRPAIRAGQQGRGQAQRGQHPPRPRRPDREAQP